MTRFFYTDPLAAAWMAKHFRMKFANGDSLRSACEAVGHDGRNMPNESAFVIDERSLHLLKPQVGDVCAQLQFNKHRPLVVREDNATYIPAESVSVSYAAELATKAALQIIHRNGVAFHWPESEAA